MFYSEDALRLFQKGFGLRGIETVNLMSQQLEKKDLNFKPDYNPYTQKITILNTSRLTPLALHEILYDFPSGQDYHDWYPVVNTQRNKQGSLEVHLECVHPKKKEFHTLDGTSAKIPGLTVEELLKKIRSDCTFFCSEAFDQKEDGDTEINDRNGFNDLFDKSLDVGEIDLPLQTIQLEEPIFDVEEMNLMEKSISEGVLNAMDQFLNKHDAGKGIWYPVGYEKYLKDELNTEMNEAFWSGFANETFFEKTGAFTFKLKAGQKASEALLSFLNGPTVADCGNATTACYYKCVLDIIGEEKFDQLFGSDTYALTITQRGITDLNCPLYYLSDYTESSKKMTSGILGKRPLKIGEECHFGGVLWYANKHPGGFSGGWNVIYCGNSGEGDQLFMAHGFERPLTEKEINQRLIAAYNRERTPKEECQANQLKKPHLYDKKINSYLIEHYTISQEVLDGNPDNFLKGFIADTVRVLQVNELVQIKNSKNAILLMPEILLKKITSLS